MGIIEDLEFKGIWRSYQQRVLDELEVHLDDQKLNVVAAPGAGKTTLGIEVMTRLGHNALILAPTITIRNQWKQRILEGFLPDDYDKTKISTDIRNITDITVSTYQALHTIYKMPEEKEKFLDSLKKKKIKTLVLDESHHLRTEWYLTLDKLCEYLESPDFTRVSLTGTPPYDVSPEEWNNYHTLCGPVDAEISIPELVKNEDLCPHQDLIYFSDLSKEEEKTVYDFDKNRSDFFRYIEKQPDFQRAVEMSRFVQEQNPDVIFKNTGFTLSVISYLLSADSLSIPAKIMTEFLELETNMIPSFDLDIAKTLVDGILGDFEPYFENAHIIKNKLKELKLLNGNKADLKGEVDFKKLFARSVNKLDAIKDITTFEYSLLKKNLREVVLLDYIGKGDSIGLNIFSVFDKLIDKKIPLGILTGTLIVIPESAKEELYKILDERKISHEKVLTTEFKKDYLRVETYGEANIVSVITELFERGEMNVLIGTAALLGEGWDSPCVNTLIIASVVGSFMLSNQMRGRALRIDKNNPEKSSNIWHLVSLTHHEGIESPDFQTVIKRFNTFEGISYKDNQIQNGISRLGKTFKEFEAEDCKKLNDKMFEYAKGRGNLKNKWEQVFKKSKINEKNMTSQMYEIIETDTHLPQIIENEGIMRRFLSDYRNRQKVEYSKFEQMKIADCILKTLCDIDVIKTPYEAMSLETDKNDNGKFSLTLIGSTSNERNIFVKSFCEVFSFDESTRYILKITRKVKEKAPESVVEKIEDKEQRVPALPVSRYKTVEKEVVKYLPVPNVIGTQQKYVKILTKNFMGEKVEKEKKPSSSVQNSCFAPAQTGMVKIYLQKSRPKILTLKEILELIGYDLKTFNESGILKRKYSDIEIQAYKRGADILITFGNCSDYERNIIINNLCDLYSDNYETRYSLRTKERDGLTYFIMPKYVYVNKKGNKYRSHFGRFFRYEKILVHVKNNNNVSKNQKTYDVLPVSMKITSVAAGIPAIILFINMSIAYGVDFDIAILGAAALLFGAVYMLTLIPIDFAAECIKHIKEGNYNYGIGDAIKKYHLDVGFSNEFIWALLYILMISIIYITLIMPIQAICYTNSPKNTSAPVKTVSKKRPLSTKSALANIGVLSASFFVSLLFVNIVDSLVFLIVLSLIFAVWRIDVIKTVKLLPKLLPKFGERIKNALIVEAAYSKFLKETSENVKIDMLYTKSAKNRGEVLKARYNAWLNADISRSRKWI